MTDDLTPRKQADQAWLVFDALEHPGERPISAPRYFTEGYLTGYFDALRSQAVQDLEAHRLAAHKLWSAAQDVAKHVCAPCDNPTRLLFQESDSPAVDGDEWEPCGKCYVCKLHLALGELQHV
jgi:hypothetical protein